jgi:hypothetical protein
MQLRLAPYCQGRVLWLEEGISWWEKAQAPRDGWYWWEPSGRVQAEALESDICDRPLQTRTFTDQADWRLAATFPKGSHVRAWSGAGLWWAVSLQLGPSPSRRERRPDLETAVTRGGGTYLSHHDRSGVFEVHWSSLSRSFRSLVDGRLNVITAGLCLSGQDRIQDLTSLVSLVVREENEGGDFGNRPW